MIRNSVDWRLFVPALLISLAGLVTMNSFSGTEPFFERQILWIVIAVLVFFVASLIDWRFLSSTKVSMTVYLMIVGFLVLLFFLGFVAHGAQSWFSLGSFAVQPSDPAKITVILVLAKYFSRRHMEIANVRHIIVSGLYAFVVAILVFLEPDFGGAVIILGIWLGMVLLSGISKKHLLAVLLVALTVIASLWTFVFAPYQKARIESFLSPLSDIQGVGYNAYQSTVAVGSGQILGKGIGLGSQSKLLFLPEYQTDFIFAAFAEEWGFIGTIILLLLSLVLVLRIIDNARRSDNNFEALFALGFALLLIIHILIHSGMNLGLLPVTGIVFPFMSYGGSHLVTEFFTLGILSSFSRRGGARFIDRG